MVDEKMLQNEEQNNVSFHRYDYLTGLPEMTWFFELASEAKERYLAEGKDPAFVYFDFNGMKLYNERYGFEAGNHLLKAFANTLVKYFTKENCCRIYSDHFVLYETEETISKIFFKMLDEWEKLSADKITIRVGIYLDSMGSVEAITACDRAKIACDSIKDTYLTRVVYFDDEMMQKLQKEHYIIETIDKAIKEKWIVVYYQPIIRAINGRVCEEEALARWVDPKYGFMSPAEFIPTLENSKLIYKLDLYVLEQILEKFKTFEKIGLRTVPHSLNLSRNDFFSCDIVEEVRKRVDAAGVDHSLISIEITESVLGTDFDFMKEQILKIRSLGFPVWMDDFGSGYSSLDVLQSVEFDLIKFDMRFMKQFDNSEKSRIILTELVKMANGISADTLCEGVEREDQVAFLKEIGCAKLQGYYFEKPVPIEYIIKKYDEGRQIGFENKDETPYYDKIGRINLYDLSMIENGGDSLLEQYFNFIPTAILQCDNENIELIRTNPSYREFEEKNVFNRSEKNDNAFKKAVKKCSKEKSQTLFDVKLMNGQIAHIFVKWVAKNPVTKKDAVAIAILAVTNSDETTYADIARALAADYFNLYYVNIDTEEFFEYKSSAGQEEIMVERHGSKFFESSRKDALKYVYPADRGDLIATFNKENILKTIVEQGVFTFTYRLMKDGVPTYVNMKAMINDDNHLIIGVSNIDTQMRQKKLIEKINQEKTIYSRITALAGEYLCTYTIDPITDRYIECTSNNTFAELGLAKEGEHFFQKSIYEGLRLIHPEDMQMYMEVFTRENIMKQAKENGIFSLSYRLRFGGEYIPVTVRAAFVTEDDGEKLILGIRKDG